MCYWSVSGFDMLARSCIYNKICPKLTKKNVFFHFTTIRPWKLCLKFNFSNGTLVKISRSCGIEPGHIFEFILGDRKRNCLASLDCEGKTYNSGPYFPVTNRQSLQQGNRWERSGCKQSMFKTFTDTHTCAIDMEQPPGMNHLRGFVCKIKVVPVIRLNEHVR